MDENDELDDSSPIYATADVTQAAGSKPRALAVDDSTPTPTMRKSVSFLEPPSLSSSSPHLFEHFIVVGPPVSAAADFASKLAELDAAPKAAGGMVLGGMGLPQMRLPSRLGSMTASMSLSLPSISMPSLGYTTLTGSSSMASSATSSGEEAALSPRTESEQTSSSTAAASSAAAESNKVNIVSVHNPHPAPAPSYISGLVGMVGSSSAATPKKKQTATTVTATAAPELLYRYPPSVDPPPSEICDFCQPLGGRLRRVHPLDWDTTVSRHPLSP